MPYTYNFKTLGTITITTAPTETMVNDGEQSYPGYAITGISGEFDGSPITGLVGTGGVYAQPNGGALFYDDTIVTPYNGGGDTDGNQSGMADSVDGLDDYGVAFKLANGLTIELYTNGSGGLQYVSSADNFATPIAAPLSSFVACYLRGTRLSTPDGEIAVEDLAIGDLLSTASGDARPVRWIGRRSYAGRFLAANPKVRPVRFRAGSLGDGMPRRDLLVSPDHAMFLDGVLIPARCLVNGTTIVADYAERVEYFHVELETHDLLLAEGAPSESFMDDDSRGAFHNAAEFATLYPDTPLAAKFCAPRVEQGAALEAILRRLTDRVAAAA